MTVIDPDYSNPTEDDFEAWVRVPAAFGLVREFVAYDASASASAILDRLKNKMLVAGARTWVKTYADREENRHEFMGIPTDLWRMVGDDFPSRLTLWQTGDINITQRTHPAMPPNIYHLYDVRFEPETLYKWIPPPKAPVSPLVPDVEPEGEKNWPVVSDKDLRDWWEIFSRTYPNATEDLAVQSAKGLFPGKRVTRLRVRELRGKGLKPGPKPKTAQ